MPEGKNPIVTLHRTKLPHRIIAMLGNSRRTRNIEVKYYLAHFPTVTNFRTSRDVTHLVFIRGLDSKAYWLTQNCGADAGAGDIGEVIRRRAVVGKILPNEG